MCDCVVSAAVSARASSTQAELSMIFSRQNASSQESMANMLQAVVEKSNALAAQLGSGVGSSLDQSF